MTERELADFTATDDRLAFLEAWFAQRGVECRRGAVEGFTHLLIRFARDTYDPGSPVKLLVAHFDRVPGSPGALNNSAACAQLASFAADAGIEARNVIVAFTDGEELSEASPTKQGAYALARALKSSGISGARAIVFDVMGRGDVALVSDAASRGSSREREREASGSARERAFELARGARAALKVAGIPVLAAPLPYSDDVGFMVAGVPAVGISLLPREEAVAYQAACARAQRDGIAWSAELEAIRAMAGEDFPRTWTLIHKATDTVELLEKRSFDLAARMLRALSSWDCP